VNAATLSMSISMGGLPRVGMVLSRSRYRFLRTGRATYPRSAPQPSGATHTACNIFLDTLSYHHTILPHLSLHLHCYRYTRL